MSVDVWDVNRNNWMSYELKRGDEDSFDTRRPFALTYARWCTPSLKLLNM